jgi:hypothetical protein
MSVHPALDAGKNLPSFFFYWRISEDVFKIKSKLKIAALDFLGEDTFFEAHTVHKESF